MTCDCCGFDYTCAGEWNPLIKSYVNPEGHHQMCYLCLRSGVEVFDNRQKTAKTAADHYPMAEPLDVAKAVMVAANTVLAELEELKAEMKELREKR